ncbi:hypothetical protein [Actinoplanes sp. NPDC051851]|uniref:hypothetical protein n=1 Tax=Actinoplanes sp. NPDC051851 TaxID=3154753 RepID=UPI00342F4583
MDRIADRLAQAADTLTTMDHRISALSLVSPVPAPPSGSVPSSSSVPSSGSAVSVVSAAHSGFVASSGFVAAAAFGAQEAGRAGRAGRRLHDRWTSALDACAEEAADLAAGLGELAESVRATARDYAEVDDGVRRRFRREP